MPTNFTDGCKNLFVLPEGSETPIRIELDPSVSIVSVSSFHRWRCPVCRKRNKAMLSVCQRCGGSVILNIIGQKKTMRLKRPKRGKLKGKLPKGFSVEKMFLSDKENK